MEIVRKWLVKEMPELTGLVKTDFERGFLFIDDNIEVRVQKQGESYELERKQKISNISSEEQKIEITQAEYTHFLTLCKQTILRDCYILKGNPDIEIKIYHGDFKGLIRIEVDFINEAEANCFVTPNWFGKEISNSDLGRDRKLIKLNANKFQELLKDTN